MRRDTRTRRPAPTKDVQRRLPERTGLWKTGAGATGGMEGPLPRHRLAADLLREQQQLLGEPVGALDHRSVPAAVEPDDARVAEPLEEVRRGLRRGDDVLLAPDEQGRGADDVDLVTEMVAARRAGE